MICERGFWNAPSRQMKSAGRIFPALFLPLSDGVTYSAVTDRVYAPDAASS